MKSRLKKTLALFQKMKKFKQKIYIFNTNYSIKNINRVVCILSIAQWNPRIEFIRITAPFYQCFFLLEITTDNLFNAVRFLFSTL